MKKHVSTQNANETRELLQSRRASDLKSHMEIKGEYSNRAMPHLVSPLDFVQYLPFLSKQLTLPFSIAVTRTEMGT